MENIKKIPLFLTPREVAKIFKLHERTIIRHVKKGSIPHKKVGQKIQIPREYIFSLDTPLLEKKHDR